MGPNPDLWWRTTALLCGYGFLKELRPSEAYLTEYLTGPWIGLTKQQVDQDVYPVWTYSYLALLVLTFLLTDFVRYKPVIVLEGLAFVVTWVLLIWGQGVVQMQVMQFTYGIATSTEVAYYTYIYAKVPKDRYRLVTSYTRAAILCGRFLSGLLSQVLVSTNVMDYGELNYISISSVSLALFVAILLPSVGHSMYFHRLGTDGDANSSCGTAVGFLWEDLRLAYCNNHILKWSVWWAFATCGNYQVGNYIQLLWEQIAPWQDNAVLYNGAVEATYTVLSAILVVSVGYLKIRWGRISEVALASCSLLLSAVLFIMATAQHVWIAYVGYAIFRVIYQIMMTIASYEVARSLPADSYGLIFGVNMFMSLILQTAVTVGLVEEVGLGLPPRSQFECYAAFFSILGAFFSALSIFRFGSAITSPKKVSPSLPSEDLDDGVVSTHI